MLFLKPAGPPLLIAILSNAFIRTRRNRRTNADHSIILDQAEPDPRPYTGLKAKARMQQISHVGHKTRAQRRSCGKKSGRHTCAVEKLYFTTLGRFPMSFIEVRPCMK